MTKKEVISKIGERSWDTFLTWMRGQTCGVTPDGEADYYECDVQAFQEVLRGGEDRQRNPLTWD